MRALAAGFALFALAAHAQDSDMGSLSLETVPSAKVSIDETAYGATPLKKVKLPPGRHTLMLTAGKKSITKAIDIQANQHLKMSLKLE